MGWSLYFGVRFFFCNVPFTSLLAGGLGLRAQSRFLEALGGPYLAFFCGKQLLGIGSLCLSSAMAVAVSSSALWSDHLSGIAR